LQFADTDRAPLFAQLNKLAKKVSGAMKKQQVFYGSWGRALPVINL
jgi:hypothetical protein